MLIWPAVFSAGLIFAGKQKFYQIPVCETVRFVMSDQKAGWGALLSGKSGLLSMVLAGGVTLHAINVYIVVTILPSIVSDIGGENYYSWAAAVFVSASLIGASLVGKTLACINVRTAYVMTAITFAVGTLGCSYAGSMPVFLLARLVQGFGGGLLLSLSYSMVRIVFERPLWPRALGIISAMWGISTLLGPAVGGIFAEYGSWRSSFQILGCFAVVFSFIAFVTMPAQKKQTGKKTPLPVVQLVLLTILVLVISTGSVMEQAWEKIAGLLVGVLLFLLLAFIDKHAMNRMLPKKSFSPKSALFSVYAMVLLVTTALNGAELYLPLFLQNLHGFGPLLAGYFASLMSIGWACGSLQGAGIHIRRLPYVIMFSPILCIIGMIVLFLLVPGTVMSDYFFLLSSMALLLTGVGTGMAWPHLLTRIMQYSDSEDADLASASLTSVQLFGSAFSAALAGTIANLAGLNTPGGPEGTAQAASALFAFTVFLLVIVVPCALRIVQAVKEEKMT